MRFEASTATVLDSSLWGEEIFHSNNLLAGCCLFFFFLLKIRATEETSPPILWSPDSPKISHSTWDEGGKLLLHSYAWTSCICKQWSKGTHLPPTPVIGKTGRALEPGEQNSTTARSTCLSLSPDCFPSRRGSCHPT